MIEGWRKDAIKANREIGKVVLAYEAGRDGSLGAPRDSSLVPIDISWLRASLIKAPRSPRDLLDHKLLAFSHWRVLSTRGADCPRRQAQLHLAGGIENGHAGAPHHEESAIFGYMKNEPAAPTHPLEPTFDRTPQPFGSGPPDPIVCDASARSLRQRTVNFAAKRMVELYVSGLW